MNSTIRNIPLPLAGPVIESIAVPVNLGTAKPGVSRSIKDRLGVGHVRESSGKAVVDIVLNPAHAATESILWTFENDPGSLGVLPVNRSDGQIVALNLVNAETPKPRSGRAAFESVSVGRLSAGEFVRRLRKGF